MTSTPDPLEALVAKVEVLRLEHGDHLALTMPAGSTLAAADQVRRHLAEHLPGVDTVVLLAGCELKVVRPACTGLSATWCPRCGSCTCAVDRADREGIDTAAAELELLVHAGVDLDSATCPLHAHDSPHAELEAGR